MSSNLYRYRYLLLGIIAAAIVGQIVFGYLTAISRIDRSSGGLADWPQYGRDQQGTRYAPLNQINRDNVASLEIAWERSRISLPFRSRSHGVPQISVAPS